MRASIDTYLAVRRAAGFQLRTHEYLLDSYARYAAEQGETHVGKQSACAWAALAPTPKQRHRRLRTVILFARFAQAHDPQHQIPPDGVFAFSRKRRIPQLFSADDVRQLLIAASQLKPTDSLRPMTYRTLFGLLASCGLRISEALRLRLDDITDDGLVIRQSKFRKSRLVPMHETTAVQLNHYIEKRKRIAGADQHLFVSTRGTALRYQTVVGTFLSLVRSLGLHPGVGKLGPRIHDLRHTFAVRALESCPAGKESIARHMLALSTYLGHAHLADTYWYLHATPGLMTHIADACEAFFDGAQP